MKTCKPDPRVVTAVFIAVGAGRNLSGNGRLVVCTRLRREHVTLSLKNYIVGMGHTGASAQCTEFCEIPTLKIDQISRLWLSSVIAGTNYRSNSSRFTPQCALPQAQFGGAGHMFKDPAGHSKHVLAAANIVSG